MANTFVPIAPNKPAAATETSLYTVPAATDSMVLSLICANTNNAALDVITVRKIPSGGTLGDAGTEILSEVDVAAKESLLFGEKLLLAAGDQLSVTSTGGNVTFTLSIIEFT